MSNLLFSILFFIVSLCWLICTVLDIRKYNNLKAWVELRMTETSVEMWQIRRELRELKEELTKE